MTPDFVRAQTGSLTAEHVRSFPLPHLPDQRDEARVGICTAIPLPQDPASKAIPVARRGLAVR